ncbi:hypothetical protein G9A89_018884 [Geosiphon pyriformis]|nr:hypothetical protein G9A89_018884 [Geosiphon pyriformis]
MARTGKIEFNAGLTFYLAAGAFVDNTIWVGNCCTITQKILNISSEFFDLIDILINTEKTVAIPINSRTSNTSLEVSRSPISITKVGKAHQYLGIFLLTKDLSGPSLKKTNSDVKFFSSIVLHKTITDKQFSYLVSAVLQPIVEYRTQFSFINRGTYEKWDHIIRKGLKSKASLPKNFPNEAVHYLFFYYLKPFEQVQAEAKVLSVLQFANDGFGISDAVGGTATYFSDLGLHVGVEVHGLLSFTLAKMQAVALALECIPASSNVTVKSHSGVLNNERTDRPGSSIVDPLQVKDINWVCTVLVWHPDSHMPAGYTSRTTTGLCTYLMKALHKKLPVAVKKCLYHRSYLSVLCIHCREVDFSDHSFVCHLDFLMHQSLISKHFSFWKSFTKTNLSLSVVLQSLASSVSNVGLYTVLCKSFVFEDWLADAKASFVDTKLAMFNLVKFVRSLVVGYRE